MKALTTSTILLLACILTTAVTAHSQTYEASSFQNDRFHPKQAFDGDMSTRWSADFKSKTGWIQVTFDKARSFKSVTIKSGIRDLKGAPKTFDVLAGAPGKLKLVKSFKDNTEDNKTFSFSKKSARTWRIEIKERISDRWSPTISEIVFGDGTKKKDDASEEVTSTDGPSYKAWTKGRSRGPLKNAFDGNSESRFEASKTGSGGWIEVTYPEPQTFDAILMQHEGETGRGVPRDFTIEIKKGRRWKKIGTQKENFTNRPRLKFKETTSASWRIKVNRLVDGQSYWSPAEIKFLKLGEMDFRPESEAKINQKKINEAIDDGLDWLKKKQRDDGSFPTKHMKEFPMGVLALGGLAMRKSGLDRDDPIIQDLVKRIATYELKKTYSVALYAMYLRAVSSKRYTNKLQTLADWLAKHQGPEGLWGYPDGRVDVSNAQYALLGLKACKEGGAKVSPKVWQKTWDWFLKNPEKVGGYRYVPNKSLKEDPVTGSMTAAALACLKICSDQLPNDKTRIRATKRVQADALKWLGDHFVAEMNPGSGRSHYYYLYGVERVGSYLKLKKLGAKKWYATGANHLVKYQFNNGSWHNSFEDTCFALLFLNRASTTGE